MKPYTRKKLLPLMCLFWLTISMAACEQEKPERQTQPPIVKEQTETSSSVEGKCFRSNNDCNGEPMHRNMTKEDCWELEGNSWLPLGEKIGKCQTRSNTGQL